MIKWKINVNFKLFLLKSKINLKYLIIVYNKNDIKIFNWIIHYKNNFITLWKLNYIL